MAAEAFLQPIDNWSAASLTEAVVVAVVHNLAVEYLEAAGIHPCRTDAVADLAVDIAVAVDPYQDLKREKSILRVFTV